jgi:imidazoleglycerol-phosphate dehydratase / histidinol-phosphatase
MRKVLFIDRDGTLIREPEDEQIDSFAKLEFYPGALQYLPRIAKELDFELVMVTNQDGLGTASHPEENFWPVHNFILTTFKNEGVSFSEVFIDRTFPHQNAATRKPGTGLLTQFFIEAEYDLAGSYVIGDRINDVILAKNLGSKVIWLRNNENLGAKEELEIPENLADTVALETGDWQKIYEFLKRGQRRINHVRATKETNFD